MKKIKIKDRIVTWSSYEVDGKLPEFIEKLTQVMKDNPKHFDFEIEAETESGWYGESSTNIVIDAYRLETDAEFDARKIEETNSKEAARLKAIRDAKEKEVREKQLYEALKRKFEKEVNASPNAS